MSDNKDNVKEERLSRINFDIKERIEGQNSIDVIIFLRKRAVASGTVITRRKQMIPIDSF